MGADLDTEDWLDDRGQLERLARPSTHFSEAHGNKEAYLVYQDGDFSKCIIGTPYNDKAVHIEVYDEGYWNSGAANIDDIFLNPNGLRRNSPFEKVVTDKLVNLEAHKANAKAIPHQEALAALIESEKVPIKVPAQSTPARGVVIPFPTPDQP